MAYQRSGTRQRRHRQAKSRTPSRPPTIAVTTKAGTATPRMFSVYECRVAPPGSRPGSVSTGTTASTVIVT